VFFLFVIGAVLVWRGWRLWRNDPDEGGTVYFNENFRGSSGYVGLEPVNPRHLDMGHDLPPQMLPVPEENLEEEL
jgi:hypothetical protein